VQGLGEPTMKVARGEFGCDGFVMAKSTISRAVFLSNLIFKTVFLPFRVRFFYFVVLFHFGLMILEHGK